MNIVVIFPQSQAARAELTHRVSQVHAEHITKTVQQLHCASTQKQQLLNAVIAKITFPKEIAD